MPTLTSHGSPACWLGRVFIQSHACLAVQVDIGAEFDGLIPILDPNTKSEQAGDHNPPRLEDQKDWTRLLEALDVGTALEVGARGSACCWHGLAPSP